MSALAAIVVVALLLAGVTHVPGVQAAAGPELNLSCPPSTIVGGFFTCTVSMNASANAVSGYRITLVYRGPAIPIPGVGVTPGSLALAYTSSALWGSSQTCSSDVRNFSDPSFPMGFSGWTFSCQANGGSSSSASPLLKFSFQASAIGSESFHLLTFAQGGAVIGSYTTDGLATPQQNAYARARRVPVRRGRSRRPRILPTRL